MKKRINVALSIESEINQKLKTIASGKSINKSELIEFILSEYVKSNYKV